MNSKEWFATYMLTEFSDASIFYDCRCAFAAGMRHAVSQITVTSDEDGNVVMVSRTDEEHRTLEIIWER